MAFTLQAESVLVYMPEQTIPFANAAFHQDITVRLGPGAYAFLGDILAPGRVARGERFAYREFDSRLRVENANGDVMLVDRTRLQPREQALEGLGLFEGYTYLGTFYALGSDPSLLAPLSDQLHAMLACRKQLLCSATELACGGVAVRVLGEDHGCVSQALYDVWDSVRQHLFGYPAVACRT
jgi:urease accessory protein